VPVQYKTGVNYMAKICDGGFKTFAVFRMKSVFFWEFPRLLDDGADIEFRNVGF
jgi:hypothetical protein